MALLWDLQEGDESALDRIEANLVGSILVCPRLLDHIRPVGLTPKDFRRETVGRAFAGVLAFVAAHPPPPDGPGYLDPVALAAFLEASGARPSVRWPWLLILSRLTDDPSADENNAAHYARAIVEGALRRMAEKAVP